MSDTEWAQVPGGWDQGVRFEDRYFRGGMAEARWVSGSTSGAMSERALSAFLLARIAEDEVFAHGATQGQWIRRPRGGSVVRADSEGRDEYVCQTSGLRWSGSAAFVAHNNPARVLAECEAKRRIVSLFSPTLADDMRAASGEYDETAFRGDQTLRALALPYADHPDYRDEWRP